MNTSSPNTARRFALSFLAYLVPTFPLGYVWHLVLFHQRYQALELYRDEVVIPLGIASMVVQGGLFAWVYPRVFSTAGEHWRGSALGFGLVFGVLAWSFTILPVAAKYRMSSLPDFLWLETAFTVLHFLVVAPLIALVNRDPR